MGALKALHGSRTAKYLLPMLSENTKRSVMQQVQEEARETGMEIPSVLGHFDTVQDIIDQKKVVIEINFEFIKMSLRTFPKKKNPMNKSCPFPTVF